MEASKETDYRKMFLNAYSNAASYKVRLEKIPSTAQYIIGCIDIPVTIKCNLKCKECSSLIPYYKKADDIDISALLHSIKKLLNSVDYVIRVNVLGGEPFISEHLWKVLNFLNESTKVERIYVITNGMILPNNNEQLLSELKSPKIQVRISHYAAYEKRQILAKWLKDNSIKYTIKEFGPNDFSWYSYGDFQYRDRSDEQLLEQNRNCDVEWYSLLNKRLYRCPRCAHATDLGIIPDDPCNYIDLDSEFEPSKLVDFVCKKSKVSACNYCDRGTPNIKKVRVAEQIEHVC